MAEKSFTKGLRVLEAVARRGEPCGIAELSKELGIGSSNVHRILTALCDAGYARRRTDMAKYELTLKLWEFRKFAASGIDAEDLVREELAALARTTGETVYVSVLDGVETVFIHQVESNQVVQARMSSRQPAYASSTGKAILAFQPEAAIDRVVATFKRLTPATVETREDFHAEMKTIRDRGFATNIGEAREDVNGIAAPIRNSVGDVISAVGVSGPANRVTNEKLEQFAASVTATAEKLSYKLGYRDT